MATKLMIYLGIFDILIEKAKRDEVEIFVSVSPYAGFD